MHKKTLIAAAITGALAAPLANAQTDVSIYGIADISYSYLDYDQTGTKSYLTSSAGSGGSRLGFNASHDLGGGLKIKANYEGGVALDNSPLYDTLFFTRQAWAGLSGSFGSIVAGQDYNLTFLTVYRGEYCGWCGVASPSMLTTDNVRDSNYVKYSSPDFGGFSFGIGHVFGEDTTATGGVGDKTEAAVFYSGGPVNVGASIRETKGATSKVRDSYLAGNVGFGIVKVYALLGQAKDNADPKTVNLLFTNLGVGFKLGAGDLNFQFARTKDKAVNDGNTTLVGVSYFHSIGKGATVYAQAARITNEANAARTSWVDGGGGWNSPAAGVDPRGVQVGFKYSF
ncbi:MAG TPA: porin [Burkholderiaceae bacterium]|nr:porin [Burkholderiaceae bacterium]